MEINKQKFKDYPWKSWLGILVIILLLVLISKSCTNNISVKQDVTFCTASQIALDERSMIDSWQEIAETGNLSSLKELKCLETLEAIWGQDQGLNDISDIVYLKNLKKIALFNTDITDISPISQLSNLETLVLNNINISSINPLQDSIANLKFLGLSNTNITDLSLLINATKLENLNLTSTPIADLSPLYDLPNLKFLILRDTTFTKPWHKFFIIPKELDEQLQELQTRHPDLIIQFTQFNVIDGEGTPFENWKYHLNYLDLSLFL